MRVSTPNLCFKIYFRIFGGKGLCCKINVIKIWQIYCIPPLFLINFGEFLVFERKDVQLRWYPKNKYGRYMKNIFQTIVINTCPSWGLSSIIKSFLVFKQNKHLWKRLRLSLSLKSYTQENIVLTASTLWIKHYPMISYIWVHLWVWSELEFQEISIINVCIFEYKMNYIFFIFPCTLQTVIKTSFVSAKCSKCSAWCKMIPLTHTRTHEGSWFLLRFGSEDLLIPSQRWQQYSIFGFIWRLKRYRFH